MEALRELRERLRKEVLAIERGVTVPRIFMDETQSLNGRPSDAHQAEASGSASITELWFSRAGLKTCFAPLAHSAAM
jgi:hypothetical protein